MSQCALSVLSDGDIRTEKGECGVSDGQLSSQNGAKKTRSANWLSFAYFADELRAA